MQAAGVVPIADWQMAAPKGAMEEFNGVPLTPARVLAITERCATCRSKMRGIVGVLLEAPSGQRFISFTDVADVVAEAADPRALAARGIGRLRHRDSPGIPGGYVSNGCPECDALFGRWRLDDLLGEHLRNGGSYSQLDTGLTLELRMPDAPARLQLRRA
jgi:hypothetical protein